MEKRGFNYVVLVTFQGFDGEYYEDSNTKSLFQNHCEFRNLKIKKSQCPNLRLIFACAFVILPLKLGVMNRLFINENNEESIAAIVSFTMRIFCVDFYIFLVIERSLKIKLFLFNQLRQI